MLLMKRQMRTIKFRVFDKSIHTYGEAVEEKEPTGQMIDNFDYIVNSDYFKDALAGKYPLMQFTGLTDKNGVEIYENDVLDNDGVVIFSEGAFMTSIGALCLSANHREVIGNIYETKDQ